MIRSIFWASPGRMKVTRYRLNVLGDCVRDPRRLTEVLRRGPWRRDRIAERSVSTLPDEIRL